MLTLSEAASLLGRNLRALWPKAYRAPCEPHCPDQDATGLPEWGENDAGDEIDGSTK
jgi:hypothetical protein